MRVLGRGEDARDGKYGDCKDQVSTQKPFRFSDYIGNMETEEEKQEGPAYTRGTLTKLEPVVPEEDSNSDDDEKDVDRS